ncbi:MAG TPA: hypothetical protein VKD72_28835 [Gemmataceae bacterium]|nr:hypothetical protein [Gemmataceae bacterium]
MSRVIIMRVRVEPDDADERSAQEIAEAITDWLVETMPHGGIGIATVAQEATLG